MITVIVCTVYVLTAVVGLSSFSQGEGRALPSVVDVVMFNARQLAMMRALVQEELPC